MRPDIEKIKKELDELLKAILDQLPGVEFVARSADYVDFIQDTPLLIEIIKTEKRKNDKFLTPFKDKKGKISQKSRFKIWGVVMQQSIWQQYAVVLFLHDTISPKVNKNPKLLYKQLRKLFPFYFTFRRSLWPFTLDSWKAKGLTFIWKRILKDFHNRLFRILDQWEIKHPNGDEETEKIAQGISFDPKKSLLHISGKWKVKIAKRGEPCKGHDILKYIFIDHKDDLKEYFYFAEIALDVFGDESYTAKPHPWTPYTTACKDIQTKVVKETKGQITDLLIFNTGKKGRVKINPKYLMKSKQK